MEVLNTERDREGNITSFLILEDGQPTLKNGTPKNILLYEHDMHQFFEDDTAMQVSKDPDVIVGSDDIGYVLSVNDDAITIPPKNEGAFLQGVHQCIENDDPGRITDLYSSIISGRVRREIINQLIHLFGEDKFSITQQSNGWLIEDFILIDWNCNVYAKDDDRDEGDYIRTGSTVTKADESHELIKLRVRDIDTETIRIGGREVELSETECEFLSKVHWLLNRRKMHPDKPFWDVVDRHTSGGGDDGPDYSIPSF